MSRPSSSSKPNLLRPVFYHGFVSTAAFIILLLGGQISVALTVVVLYVIFVSMRKSLVRFDFNGDDETIMLTFMRFFVRSQRVFQKDELTWSFDTDRNGKRLPAFRIWNGNEMVVKINTQISGWSMERIDGMRKYMWEKG